MFGYTWFSVALAWVAIGFVRTPFDRLAGRFVRAYGTRLPYRVLRSAGFLYGEREAEKELVLLCAKSLRIMHAVIGTALLLASALEEDRTLVIGFGAAVAPLVPVLMVRGMERRVNERNRRMVMELPLYMNTVSLLLLAGETLPRALGIAASAPSGDDHPLYAELRRSLEQHRVKQIPLDQALESFAFRCALHEVSIFVNGLVLNYRRGTADLSHALRLQSGQMAASRMAAVRTLGEEASGKLLFPMVTLFLIVLAIVATPALVMVPS